MEIANSLSVATNDFLNEGSSRFEIDRKQSRIFISRLLKLAWDQFLESRNLSTYEMANQTKCFYFFKNMISKDTIQFTGIDGSKSYRHVVGYKTIKENKRYWHFGIQAKPLVYPELAYVIKPHVLFSNDGENIWENKERMHKIRRSQCKDWWNPHWRDRILAAMKWLSNEEDKIEIPLGNELIMNISDYPIIFESPVSYYDPEETSQTLEYDELDEDEFDDIEHEEAE